MKQRIVLTGGGTGGSVTPLLALAQELRRRHPDVDLRFIGSMNGPEKMLAENAGLQFTAIASGKWRRYWSGKNFTDLVQVWRGYRQAKKLLQQWQPQVVISAGSFVSVPIIWAAHRLQIATVIHQQDVRPGLANRLMAPTSTVVTTTFQSSSTYFPRHKTVWIGNPVRAEILHGSTERAKVFFHLNDSMPVLLILGGGTGSDTLNAMITSILDQLTRHWQVIHVTGSAREPIVSTDANYQTYTFLQSELADAMTAATVIVSRAGLGAISELAALGKTAIFIPMPSTHQEDNARMITDASAGIVLQQNITLASKLLEQLEYLRTHDSEAANYGSKLQALNPLDAVEKLADQVERLLPS